MGLTSFTAFYSLSTQCYASMISAVSLCLSECLSCFYNQLHVELW